MSSKPALVPLAALALVATAVASGGANGGILFRDCLGSETFDVQPAAVLAPKLPPGFAPSAAASLDGAGQLNVVTHVVMRCSLGDVAFVDSVVFAFVDPPEELRTEEHEFSLLFLDVIAGSDATYQWYQANGFGPVATRGDVTLEVYAQDGLRLWTRGVANDGTTRLDSTALSMGEELPWPGAHLRVFGAHEGELHGSMSATYTDHFWTGAADQYVSGGWLKQRGPGPFTETLAPFPVASGHEYGYDMALAPAPLR